MFFFSCRLKIDGLNIKKGFNSKFERKNRNVLDPLTPYPLLQILKTLLNFTEIMLPHGYILLLL